MSEKLLIYLVSIVGVFVAGMLGYYAGKKVSDRWYEEHTRKPLTGEVQIGIEGKWVPYSNFGVYPNAVTMDLRTGKYLLPTGIDEQGYYWECEKKKQ